MNIVFFINLKQEKGVATKNTKNRNWLLSINNSCFHDLNSINYAGFEAFEFCYKSNLIDLNYFKLFCFVFTFVIFKPSNNNCSKLKKLFELI